VLLVALYLLLRTLLAHAEFRDRVSSLAVPLAAGIGAIYLWANAGRWIDWWGAIGALRLPPLRPFSEGLTFGNPSAVLAISVLLTAPAIAHVGLATRARRAAVTGLALLSTAVTLVSGSRAGWLAVGTAVIVVAVLGLASPAGRRALRGLFRTWAARVGAIVGGLAAGAAALVLTPAILLRVGAGGEDLRSSYLVIAGRLFEDAPLTGVGAGNWVVDRIAATASGETDYYIPHAHNVYAQTAAEHGLLGLLAGAIAIGCLAWLIRGALRDPDEVRRRWAWAALFASVYFGVHQLLDFYANFPAMIFAFALPVAWLDATAPRSITAGFAPPRIGAGARRLVGVGAALTAAVVLAVSVAGLVAQEAPAQAMDTGRDAAGRGDWAAALPLFRAANDADPAMPAYTFARGLGEARAGDPARALTALESVAASDDLPVAWLDVAALRQAAGDVRGALVALDRALRLGRQQPGVLFAAGAILERAGDMPAADADWATTLQALPSLAGDPWWTDPARAARWPGIRAAALAGMAPETATDLWLSSGDTTQAAASAAQIADPAARQRTQLAVAAWSGSSAARSSLDVYAQDHPFDMTAVAWAGRVAARAGDLVGLQRYRVWAITVTNTAFQVGEVRVAPAGVSVSPAGLNSPFWGQYTYRRATPQDQLVPSLPHLVPTP
jgi:tetratricopeptide (TPR) repeat protein